MENWFPCYDINVATLKVIHYLTVPKSLWYSNSITRHIDDCRITENGKLCETGDMSSQEQFRAYHKFYRGLDHPYIGLEWYLVFGRRRQVSISEILWSDRPAWQPAWYQSTQRRRREDPWNVVKDPSKTRLLPTSSIQSTSIGVPEWWCKPHNFWPK